jgi:hypothetical protein
LRAAQIGRFAQVRAAHFSLKTFLHPIDINWKSRAGERAILRFDFA